MKVVFWGVRGSTPAPGQTTVRYGGNTSCMELRLGGGELIICDAGTGIRPLGLKLLREGEGEPTKGYIFFSHFHWDHIQGFPFFRPAFVKGNEFTLIGAPPGDETIQEILVRQMNSVNFPVNFQYLSADFHYQPVSNNVSMEIGATHVRFIEVNHTSRCAAVRFEEKGKTLVYMTDNELERSSPTPFRNFVNFCDGADVLIHDAQYTPETYGGHEGWGHSSWQSVIRLAMEAGVKRLYLYHHDPESDDSEVDEILVRAKSSAGDRGLEIFAAHERMEISI